MKTYGSYPSIAAIATAAGALLEPATSEKVDGFQASQRWPAKKVNWFLNQLERWGSVGIRSVLGSFFPSASTLGLSFTGVKWDPIGGVWLGLQEGTSGRLWWSYDGSYWQQGALFSGLSSNPLQMGLEVFYNNLTMSESAVFFATTGDIYRSLDPLSSTGTFTAYNSLATTLDAGSRLFTRNTPSGVHVAAHPNLTTPIMVLQPTGTDWEPVTGITGSVVFADRVAHYTGDTWFAVGSGVSGYSLSRFYDDDTKLDQGATIYEFFTNYPNFTPSSIEIDPYSGRIIVAGRDTTVSFDLRILYSDDFGITFADCIVPDFDFGGSASGTERIRYLGGSFWIAQMGPTSGYVNKQCILFSYNGGINWFHAVTAGGVSGNMVLSDFDFNGDYWMADYYASGNEIRVKGALLP